jgi:hypothetical protein
VFVGTVVGRTPVRLERQDGGYWDGYAVEFAVAKAWKGAGAERIVVWSGSGGGDCGYPFEIGQAYLVYAHHMDDGELTTGVCTRTGLLALRVDDVGELERSRAERWTRVVVVLGLVMFLVGVAVGRVWRHQSPNSEAEAVTATDRPGG